MMKHVWQHSCRFLLLSSLFVGSMTTGQMAWAQSDIPRECHSTVNTACGSERYLCQQRCGRVSGDANARACYSRCVERCVACVDGDPIETSEVVSEGEETAGATEADSGGFLGNFFAGVTTFFSEGASTVVSGAKAVVEGVGGFMSGLFGGGAEQSSERAEDPLFGGSAGHVKEEATSTLEDGREVVGDCEPLVAGFEGARWLRVRDETGMVACMPIGEELL